MNVGSVFNSSLVVFYFFPTIIKIARNNRPLRPRVPQLTANRKNIFEKTEVNPDPVRVMETYRQYDDFPVSFTFYVAITSNNLQLDTDPTL